MNLNLGKWQPFKFLRKSPEEKRNEASSSAALTAGGGYPASTADPLRMMQEMLREPFSGFGQLDRWFGDFSPSAFQPRIDVVDEGESLRITAELPGMSRQDVEVVYEDDALLLRGEKKHETKTEEKGCYRVERSFGSFQRLIPLPEGVDINRAEANFDKGTLNIRIPKTAEHKSKVRRIEIK